jgi:hypothetical protein
MRANIVSRMLMILVTSAYVLLIACKADYAPFTQPDPVSVNQEFMMSEVQRFTPALGIGEFVVTFKDPPSSTYAGWADCKPGGRAPWYIHFNKDYIEGLDPIAKRPYMSALVAHEMCHHWVTSQSGGCWDEVAAETCASNLVAFGRPR